MLAAEKFNHVTVIDDDELARQQLIDDLQEYDYQTHALTQSYGKNLERLVSDIQEQPNTFVICDYKLQPSGLASFYGTEVVSALTLAKVPSMLLTMYQSTYRLHLRRHRRLIPVIVRRDGFEIEHLAEHVQICLSEFSDNPVDSRKPHRSLIRVDDTSNAKSGHYIDAVIPSWRSNHAVSIPIDCLSNSLRGIVRAGNRLIGDVNTDATDEDDLFFANIELLAEPGDETAR